MISSKSSTLKIQYSQTSQYHKVEGNTEYAVYELAVYVSIKNGHGRLFDLSTENRLDLYIKLTKRLTRSSDDHGKDKMITYKRQQMCRRISIYISLPQPSTSIHVFDTSPNPLQCHIYPLLCPLGHQKPRPNLHSHTQSRQRINQCSDPKCTL